MGFWESRVRRLVPAVVLGTMVAGVAGTEILSRAPVPVSRCPEAERAACRANGTLHQGTHLIFTAAHAVGFMDMGYSDGPLTPSGQWNGMVVDMLDYIASKGGFTYELWSPRAVGDEALCPRNVTTRDLAVNYNCAVENIVEGVTHGFVGLFYATRDRGIVARQTVPYLSGVGLTVVVPVRRAYENGALTIFRPLSASMWFGTVAIVIFVTLVLAFSEHADSKHMPDPMLVLDDRTWTIAVDPPSYEEDMDSQDEEELRAAIGNEALERAARSNGDVEPEFWSNDAFRLARGASGAPESRLVPTDEELCTLTQADEGKEPGMPEPPEPHTGALAPPSGQAASAPKSLAAVGHQDGKAIRRHHEKLVKAAWERRRVEFTNDELVKGLATRSETGGLLTWQAYSAACVRFLPTSFLTLTGHEFLQSVTAEARAYVTLFAIFCLVWIATYTANLAAFFADIRREIVLVQGLEDIAIWQSRGLIGPACIQAETLYQPFLERNFPNVEFVTVSGAYDALLTAMDEGECGVIVDAKVLAEWMSHRKEYCDRDLTTGEAELRFGPQDLVVGIRRDLMDLEQTFNYWILALRSCKAFSAPGDCDGTDSLATLYEKWVLPTTCSISNGHRSTDRSDDDIITPSDYQLLFLALIISGVVLVVLALCREEMQERLCQIFHLNQKNNKTLATCLKPTSALREEFKSKKGFQDVFLEHTVTGHDGAPIHVETFMDRWRELKNLDFREKVRVLVTAHFLKTDLATYRFYMASIALAVEQQHRLQHLWPEGAPPKFVRVPKGGPPTVASSPIMRFFGLSRSNNRMSEFGRKLTHNWLEKTHSYEKEVEVLFAIMKQQEVLVERAMQEAVRDSRENFVREAPADAARKLM